MPHFITIIKYEFIHVKYILALYYTIVRSTEPVSAAVVRQNEPNLLLTITKPNHLLKLVRLGCLPLSPIA